MTMKILLPLAFISIIFGFFFFVCAALYTGEWRYFIPALICFVLFAK